MITALDAWVFAALTSGQTLNGKLDSLSAVLRPMADHLNGLAKNARGAAWLAMMAARPDAAELVKAVADQDPTKPPPAAQASIRQFATAGDLRRVASTTPWTWPLWIPGSGLSGFAAFEGTGKSRLLLDLARRIWHHLVWPDGQPPTFPKHTPTLWLCSDGQQGELLDMMTAFKLPDEAIYFPAAPDEPYEGTSLDDPELIKPGGILETAIATVRPGLTFIDTMTNATRRDLCSQDQVSTLKGPLIRICQTQKASMVLSLHLSKEGQALGRRSKGITRVLSHLECPDPANYQRLRLWVEKSHAKKPEALGVTMEDGGERS